MNNPFGQVLTAAVTPFDSEGRLDLGEAERLFAHLAANGSDGLVICGTTGESPTLSHDEKLTLFKLARSAAPRSCKVVAGTSGNDTAASVALTREAAEIGVDGVLLVVPPYNRPSQEGMYRHFRAIADSVPGLACLLYNVPPRTAQNLDARTVQRLSADVPNIAGVKEASGNLVQCAEIAAGATEGFALYSGDDGLTLPMLAIGAVGVVSVTSHLVGRDIKAMHQAFFAGRFHEAAALNAAMLPIVRACFQPTTPSPAPVKAALEMLGFAVGAPRLPLVEATADEKRIVRAALEQYGLLGPPALH